MWESKGTTLRKGAQTLGSVFYYLFCCPFIEPRRTVEFLRNVYFYKQAESVRWLDQTVIPSVPPEDLFPGLFTRPVQVLELGGTPRGGTTLYESYLLACIVQSLRPQILFEFGTFEGRTTLQLALNSPPDAVVYTLDLPNNYVSTRFALSFPEEGRERNLPVGGFFQSYAEAGKIRQLLADSATADYKGLRGSVDFILIDADHGYNYVKSDSANAFAMRSPRGVILWHDYGSKWRDVTLLLRDVATQERKSIYHLEGTNLAVYAPSIIPSKKPEVARASSFVKTDRKVHCMSRNGTLRQAERTGI